MNPAVVIDMTLELLIWAILIEVAFSWLPPPKRRGVYASIRQAFSELTEPLFTPVRRLLPPLSGAVDFSPFVVVLVIEILRKLVRNAF